MLAASSNEIKKMTDGDLRHARSGHWFGVFEFKDGKKATFDQFETYVPESDQAHQIELFYGNDSPTGNFTSLGVFKPYDGLLTDSPFQKFTFPPVTARYFRVEKKGYNSMYEIRLTGTLE